MTLFLPYTLDVCFEIEFYKNISGRERPEYSYASYFMAKGTKKLLMNNPLLHFSDFIMPTVGYYWIYTINIFLSKIYFNLALHSVKNKSSNYDKIPDQCRRINSKFCRKHVYKKCVNAEN